MAIVGLMMGSILGLCTGVFGWLAFDMAVLSAFTLYLCTALGMTALTVIVGSARAKHASAHSGTEAFQP